GARYIVIVFSGRRRHATRHRPNTAAIGGAGGALSALTKSSPENELGIYRPARGHLLDARSAIFRRAAPGRHGRFPLARAAARSHDGTRPEIIAGLPIWGQLSCAKAPCWRGIARRSALSSEVRCRTQSRPMAALLQPGISLL